MRLNSALTAAASLLAIGASALSAPAYAQSTGSIDFEKEIVVSGSRTTQQVGGVSAPDTAKAKAVLTQENLAHQNPGQTVLDTINQIPGVNFQNNDAYGSSGGTLNIRGFSSDRVSLTFDGVPLNDSGSYAIFSNQQIDPELIEQVNVNLGTTDVDSPTASAAGGTVNLRTLTPSRDFGVMVSESLGQFDFFRLFAKIETGDINASGLRAWFSASRTKNDNPFNNYGKVSKQQYNAKIYQPLGGNDFIAVAGHYNQNRNNFFGSLPLRTDLTQSRTNLAPRVVGSGSSNRFPTNADERKYNINFPCQTDVPQAGVADATNSCGTEFDRRYNPSNTGNIRVSSRFSLSNSLTLTVDPSYQYVKANGGGTVTGREGTRAVGTIPAGTGFIGGSYFFGKDLNGDGDLLDQVILMAPSQTQTHRIGVITGLRWEMNDTNTLRLSYTYDRARHRQTGEAGQLRSDGEPFDVFPINNPLQTAGGFSIQKRDRLSYAILHQISGEYRGEFMDDKLVVTAGLRVPFFRRNLNNNCFATSAGGNVDCFSQTASLNAAYATANPTVQGPQQRIYNYSKALPNVGLTFEVMENLSLFGNFSQGLSVPGTDNLYNAFFFAPDNARAKPAPETTDNFDVGLRYRSAKIQGSISGFYNQFHNRLASAYDPELDQNVYRNLGNVKKYGIDGYVAFQPVEQLTFYAFGSVLKSEIKDNVAIGENAIQPGATTGTPIYAATAGKRESGAAKYTFGGTVRGALGPLDIGLTAKRTGERFIFDTNLPTFQGSFIPVGATTGTGTAPALTPAQIAATGQIYGATAPAYWLLNLDARLKLDFLGLTDGTYLQLNVYNLTNTFYVGGFGGGLSQSATFTKATGVASYGSPGFVQIGAPRTISATAVFKF